MLRSRLYQHYTEIQKQEQAAKEDAKMAIAWGSQIRSYFFQPHLLVKDHRTNHSTGNVTAVMDGDLDGFMETYLKLEDPKTRKKREGAEGAWEEEARYEGVRQLELFAGAEA